MKKAAEMCCSQVLTVERQRLLDPPLLLELAEGGICLLCYCGPQDYYPYRIL